MKVISSFLEIFQKGPEYFVKKTVILTLYIIGWLFVLLVTYSYLKTAFLPYFDPKLYTSDFTAYLTAAHLIKEGNVNKIYDLPTQVEYQEKVTKWNLEESVLAFKNPPIAAYIYLPFAFLPSQLAYRVNVIVQFFTILVGLFILLKALNLNNRYFLPALLYLPVTFSILYGQLSTIIFLVFIFALVALKKEKYFLAGLISGLLFLKFQYLLFIPYVLIVSKNRKQLLIGILSSIGILTLASLLLYGPSFINTYIPYLLKGENVKHGTEVLFNYNLFGLSKLIFPLFSERLRFVYTLILSIAAYITSLLLIFKTKKNLSLEESLSTAVIFSMVFNIHTQAVDTIYLTIPFLYFLHRKGGISKLIVGAIYISSLLGLYKLEGLGALLLILTAILIVVRKEISRIFFKYEIL